MSESMRVFAVDVLFFLQNQTLKIRWLDFASKNHQNGLNGGICK
jgi:hypothetical protein